ncbi:hypothetical protein BH09PAT2_BH09PAT2_00290 [soil metagenome]
MNKKIIVILTIVILILVVITFIILSRRNITSNISSKPITGLEDISPGIIIPTNNIKAGQLDIVAVSPADLSSKITKTVPIEITFSQPIKANEIEFMISPDFSYDQTIEGNKLIISPKEDFKTSTLYTYSVNFLKDLQKVRMYTFSTAGDGPIFRPDTGPSKEEIIKYDESVRVRYPDIYLQNHTPYETTIFGITGTYSKQKEHFEFKVLLKGTNKNDARNKFILWLQSLDLTDKQIESLDITYE